nr:NAD-dependent epimerase/dehydratase family protein [Clostridia bacterium]
MKTMLVTGGTVFVSRYAAEYFQRRGWQVSVLNRGTRRQPEGVELIRADRHDLGETLRRRHFDAVLDVTAYTAEDVNTLLDALGGCGQYILISSSAVYPETEVQPFREDAAIGPNIHWGRYGTDKIAAEQALRARNKDAYILRPPYLYGPGNNVYREAFVFDCAQADRPFYLPGDGSMKLHFLHVDDLWRFAEILLEKQPAQRIFNVGAAETVTIRQWVTACYAVCGKSPIFVSVPAGVEQRQYFPFYNYEYALDVSAQCGLMKDFIPLEKGLTEALAWYRVHGDEVRRKPLLEYIDCYLS